MISDLILKANEFLINDSCNNIDNEYKFELINVKHSSSIIQWRNNLSNYSLMVNQNKLNNELQQEFLDKYDTLDRLDFILIHISSKKYIGSFSLNNISTDTPEIGKLLGDKNFRGKCLGYKSTKLLLFFIKKKTLKKITKYYCTGGGFLLAFLSACFFLDTKRFSTAFLEGLDFFLLLATRRLFSRREKRRAIAKALFLCWLLDSLQVIVRLPS